MISTDEMQTVKQIDVRAMIRTVCENDAALLLDYYCALAQEAVNNTSIRPDVLHRTVSEQTALLRRYFIATDSQMFVAEFRERIIGMIKCVRQADPLLHHTIEVSINVHPDYRGLGVGSGLLRHALAWAQQERRITRVQLEVLTRNENAMRLYERFGFVCEGVRQRAYHFRDEGHHAYEDAIMMRLLLPLDGGE